MKKHSEVVTFDPATGKDKVFEIHSETSKKNKTTSWYVKDTTTDDFLNKEDPMDKCPTVEEVFKLAGGK